MSSSKVKYVDHTYRDFSRYTDDGGQLVKHKKSESNFPAKLHTMLSDLSHSHIITWMPHGRAFKIIDKDALFNSVIPQYYVCNKYESFTRQLNAWGFKRLYQSGPDLGCHYHECFLRGLPKLTCLIRRLPPSQGKATPYPAGEPNFYTISAAFPLPASAPAEVAARTPAEGPLGNLGNPGAAGGATRRSTLDPPSHGPSPSESRHPTSSFLQSSTQGYAAGLQLPPSIYIPTQLQEPPHQDSIATLAEAALGDAPAQRGQSAEVQYPSYSTAGPVPQPYSSARMTYETPHRMPQQYAPGYRYPQPQGHTGHAQASATPTQYALPLGDPGRQYGSGYGPHGPQSTPGPPPPYQYQTPQYQFPQPRPPRPRFLYPPPQMPQHYVPGSVAPTGGHVPQGSYRQYQRTHVDTGQGMQQPATSRVSHDTAAHTPGQSSRHMDEGGLTIEPLPYSPRSRSRKDTSGSPAQKKRKPDPPP